MQIYEKDRYLEASPPVFSLEGFQQTHIGLSEAQNLAIDCYLILTKIVLKLRPELGA